MTETRSDAETETLHSSTAQYRAFVREQPSFALALTAQIMAEHAAMLEKLRELATLSVEQRLAVALARMAHQRTFVDNTGEVVLDATHYRVLCELVGATRESVSLVLNRLIASGVAERIDGRVLVHPCGIPVSPELGWSEPVIAPGATAAIPGVRARVLPYSYSSSARWRTARSAVSRSAPALTAPTSVEN